jgi:hypothetical protein
MWTSNATLASQDLLSTGTKKPPSKSNFERHYFWTYNLFFFLVRSGVAIVPAPVIPEQKHEIPDDLICSICKDLFTDAVMIPCCGSSFCDECK